MESDNFIILVTGILRNQKNEILLLQRSKNNNSFKGFWQMPEGKMEVGEQPEQTLARELKEELNYKLIDSKLTLVNSTFVSLKNKSYHLLRIVLEITWKGKITLSTEHNDYRWINVKEAIKLRNLVVGTREILLTQK